MPQRPTTWALPRCSSTSLAALCRFTLPHSHSLPVRVALSLLHSHAASPSPCTSLTPRRPALPCFALAFALRRLYPAYLHQFSPGLYCGLGSSHCSVADVCAVQDLGNTAADLRANKKLSCLDDPDGGGVTVRGLSEHPVCARVAVWYAV